MANNQPMHNTVMTKALLARANMLRDYIARRLPAEVERVVSIDDVLQEVWVRAHRSAHDVGQSPIDDMDRWLTALASHALVDQLRSAQAVKRGGRRVKLDAANLRNSYLDLFNQALMPRSTPSSNIAIDEAITAVQAALTKLPENQATVVRMRYVDGLSYEQIAENTERSVPAVRGLMSRGMSNLRAELRSAARFFSDASTGTDHISLNAER